MTRIMATWVIIAALATIGVTALLMGVLYRLNTGASARLERPRAGGVSPAVDPGGAGKDDRDGGVD
jgi:hypothetical protein